MPAQQDGRDHHGEINTVGMFYNPEGVANFILQHPLYFYPDYLITVVFSPTACQLLTGFSRPSSHVRRSREASGVKSVT